MAYNNVNRRILILVNAGLLEDLISDNKVSLHGRKDYKLSMKGLELLIPHILAHPKDVQNIVQYMDKFRMDKERFHNLIVDRMKSMVQALNLFEKHAEVGYTPVIVSREAEKTAKEVKELHKQAGFRFRGDKEE